MFWRKKIEKIEEILLPGECQCTHIRSMHEHGKFACHVNFLPDSHPFPGDECEEYGSESHRRWLHRIRAVARQVVDQIHSQMDQTTSPDERPKDGFPTGLARCACQVYIPKRDKGGDTPPKPDPGVKDPELEELRRIIDALLSMEMK